MLFRSHRKLDFMRSTPEITTYPQVKEDGCISLNNYMKNEQIERRMNREPELVLIARRETEPATP